MQIRGVTPEAHPALIEGLTALGLIDRDVAAETRRNLVIQPFWAEGDATHRTAQALTEALAHDDAPNLPGKFGFAVDTGEAPILRAVSADIRIERAGKGLLVYPDGAEAPAERAAIIRVEGLDWNCPTTCPCRGRFSSSAKQPQTKEADQEQVPGEIGGGGQE